MEKLQKRLKPEWEPDYMNELSDDPDSGVSKAFEALKESEKGYGSLQEMRFLQTVDDKLRKTEITENLVKLRRYQAIIKESRQSLQPLADYLVHFGSELNKLSLEMEFLQKRSNSLNSNIEDKKLLDSKLTPLINDLAIPPEVVRSITDGPIDSRWVENLHFIQEKREIYKKYAETVGVKTSLRDLSHLLDLLELKCVERIRNYLVSQIKRFRKPAVASQVIQKEMLDSKEIFSFLLEHNKDLATELRKAYCHTMRWYYHQNFVKYMYSLEKLKLIQVDKNVLLGSLEESSGNSTGAASFFSRGYNSSSYTPEITLNEYLINIPKRFDLLTNEDQTAILAQIAETNNTKYWIEAGFKNFNQALMDNVSTEYLFLNEFFEISTLEEATEVTKLVFSPVYQLGYNYTKYLISDSYDWFGVLIMVRMCQSLEYELQHRRVPVLEDYLNYQLILLWPKFQSLIDHNMSTMKKAASSSAVIKTMSKNIMIPLMMTQNFGMVLTNLIRLSSNLMFEIETWEPLTNSVIRLSNEFESCLIKLSASLQGKKKQEIFLYNNFFLIYSILSNELEEEESVRMKGTAESLDQEKHVSDEMNGKKTLAELEKDHFKKLVEAYGETE
ncbi:DEKNAAC100611 [Brettanomyces naardenensis]|uniref:DEKNAAC100611 n=1 Tax=Brettanomyces naardenensis TaxID=13370 RepID=A0A448YGJ6_BRENA|nr:DEKNAAC100611 [Brettanomyces naardenensis]